MTFTAAPLDRLDPRTRVLAAAAFCVAVSLLQTGVGLAAALLCAAGLTAAAGLPAKTVLRRLAALEGFLLAGVAALPFAVPGEPAFTLFGLVASQPGLERAGLILGKATAAALAAAALLGALEPVALGRALARLGAPDKLTHLYLFTARYIHVLLREYRRLTLAMKARGFRPGCNRHTWRTYGWLFGMLTVRSLERADRVLAAMRCRGFDGRLLPLTEDRPFRLPDGVFAALALGVAAAAASVSAATASAAAGAW